MLFREYLFSLLDAGCHCLQGQYRWPYTAEAFLFGGVAQADDSKHCSISSFALHILPAGVQLGCQEKATFLQAFGKKAVYSGFLRLPAVTELLLLATVLLVLWQYSPAAAPPSARRQQVQYTAVQADEEGGASGST